jgi:hypothetical protein
VLAVIRARSLAAACLAPLILLSACGGVSEEGNVAADGANEAAAEGLGAVGPLNEAEAAALADEAAADEAADTNMFGGNAAAGETGNGAALPGNPAPDAGTAATEAANGS